MTARKPVDPWERTEEVWAAEYAYILKHSLVATEATLAKRDTWDDLPAYRRATLTTQARACLTAALHPTPTRGPLDGQEPLIGET